MCSPWRWQWFWAHSAITDLLHRRVPRTENLTGMNCSLLPIIMGFTPFTGIMCWLEVISDSSMRIAGCSSGHEPRIHWLCYHSSHRWKGRWQPFWHVFSVISCILALLNLWGQRFPPDIWVFVLYAIRVCTYLCLCFVSCAEYKHLRTHPPTLFWRWCYLIIRSICYTFFPGYAQPKSVWIYYPWYARDWEVLLRLNASIPLMNIPNSFCDSLCLLCMVYGLLLWDAWLQQ